MRHTLCLALLMSPLMLPGAFASDVTGPGIFFTARFEPGTSVSLRLIENSISPDPDFDFDVVIGVSEANNAGAIVYADHSRHPARVRCAAPAAVRVSGVDYAVDAGHAPGQDWKHDLWVRLCSLPVS